MKIFHNPRCSKSRQGLSILQEANVDIEIIEYLKNPLGKDDVVGLIKKLGISAIDLVRKNEAIWKEEFKNKPLSEEQIVQAMVDNPKLIERPIVVHGNKAVIGRPPENINSLL